MNPLPINPIDLIFLSGCLKALVFGFGAGVTNYLWYFDEKKPEFSFSTFIISGMLGGFVMLVAFLVIPESPAKIGIMLIGAFFHRPVIRFLSANIEKLLGKILKTVLKKGD